MSGRRTTRPAKGERKDEAAPRSSLTSANTVRFLRILPARKAMSVTRRHTMEQTNLDIYGAEPIPGRARSTCWST